MIFKVSVNKGLGVGKTLKKVCPEIEKRTEKVSSH